MQQDSARDRVGGRQPTSNESIREYMKSREVYRSDDIAICVDAFHYSRNYLQYCRSKTNNESFTSLFFLSHFHSDHYSGINRSWCHGTIYASRPTANMLCWKLGVGESVVKALEFGFTYVFSLESGNLLYEESDHDAGIKENECGLNWRQRHEERIEKCFSVALIPANHCPGAAMFVFRSALFGNIVHTGDFRFSFEDQSTMGEIQTQCPMWEFSISKSPVLTSIAGLVDVLFLDNTFCDPRFDFPSQVESIHTVNQATLSMFSALESRSGKTSVSVAVLIGTYSIGKERIALSLQETFMPVVQQKTSMGAHDFFVPTYVSQNRYDSLRQLEYFVERFTPLPQCGAGGDQTEVVGYNAHEISLPTQPQSVARDLFSFSSPPTSGDESPNAEAVRYYLTIFLVPISLMTYPELAAVCKRQNAMKRSRDRPDGNATDAHDHMNGDGDVSSPAAAKELLPLWEKEVLNLAQFDGVLCVAPTGWTKKAKQQKVSERVSLLHVPYSEHCSFSEMVDFVSFINPSRVVPTVSMELFKKYESFFAEKAPRLRLMYSNTQPLNRFLKPKTEILNTKTVEKTVVAATAVTSQNTSCSVDGQKQRNPFAATIIECAPIDVMNEIENEVSISASTVGNSSVHIVSVTEKCDGKLNIKYTSERVLKQNTVHTKKVNRTSQATLQNWQKICGDNDDSDDDDCVIVHINPCITEVSDSSDIDDDKCDKMYK